MLLSLVIPIFNESESLPLLFASLRKLRAGLDCDCEVVLVNDGSKDGSLEILKEEAARDPWLRVISFSRNFGHQAAITAGLDFAQGDAAVVMDADLQDPPEIIPDMVKLYRQGYDVVSAQRASRNGDSFFKRSTASFFYWLMQTMVDERILPEVGDFRLFSRNAITAIQGFREQHRFMRGLVAWLGLKEAVLPFHREHRRAGTTKYSTLKMLRFAWTAISSFSALPLRLSIAAGVLLSSVAVLYALYAIVRVATGHAVAGWASLACLQCFFSGAIFLAVGLTGDYVARIYEEAKGRPLYIINNLSNLPMPVERIPRALVLPAREPARELQTLR